MIIISLHVHVKLLGKKMKDVHKRISDIKNDIFETEKQLSYTMNRGFHDDKDKPLFRALINELIKLFNCHVESFLYQSELHYHQHALIPHYSQLCKGSSVNWCDVYGTEYFLRIFC